MPIMVNVAIWVTTYECHLEILTHYHIQNQIFRLASVIFCISLVFVDKASPQTLRLSGREDPRSIHLYFEISPR